jgi:hypothetical protein
MLRWPTLSAPQVNPARGFFFQPETLQQSIVNNSASAEVLAIMKVGGWVCLDPKVGGGGGGGGAGSQGAWICLASSVLTPQDNHKAMHNPSKTVPAAISLGSTFQNSWHEIWSSSA